jgi:hypothetical protein
MNKAMLFKTITGKKQSPAAQSPLTKITLLEKSCEYFRRVIIPELVFDETVKVGKERGHEDAVLIENAIRAGRIKVKRVREKTLIKRRMILISSGESGGSGIIKSIWTGQQ